MSVVDQLLKLVTTLLTPLGLALALALLGLALRRRWLVLIAVVWLGVWSAPRAALWLGGTLEYRHPIQPIVALPVADAIVVLGGGSGAPVPPWFPEENLNGSADRYVFAAKLWHAGKAPWLLVSGGGAEGSVPEARTAAELLRLMGVAPAAIVLESASRTTRENAALSIPMLRARGVRRVLLVTSVWHMPRALINFQALAPEIEWIAAGCDQHDFTGTGLPGGWWWPNTEALDFSQRVFKEWLGIAWARIGGR